MAGVEDRTEAYGEDRVAVEGRILSSAPAFVTRRRRGGVTFGRDWQEIDRGELDLEAIREILEDPFLEVRELRPGGEIPDKPDPDPDEGDDSASGAPRASSGDDPPSSKADPPPPPKAKRTRGKKK